VEYVFGDITVACTNTDRVVFPDVGITKGEVIAYYASVADIMVPELRDRPLTIERFTKGVDKGGFYQKHAQKHYPAWIERIELGTKTKVAYPLCDSPAALVYFANQGGFVLHVWTSRKQAPANPDEVVFDLDPPENGFAMVQQTARILHELLEELSLSAFVKTTGSKGLHIVAPLDGKAGYDEVHGLCSGIAKLLCTRHPDLLTTEFYKKDRKGRLFLDTGRNSFGATMVAPYSLRGRPNAPVSAPIEWEELDDVTPDGITLGDIARRLDQLGDPWSNLRARPGSLRMAAQALAKISDT
jgi:bifunctional non-homologous end joining protein LigD